MSQRKKRKSAAKPKKSQVFLLYPRNREFIATRQGRPAGLEMAMDPGIAGWGCGILFLLVFNIGLFVILFGGLKWWATLENQGQIASGEIVERYTRNCGDDDMGTCYHVVFNYTVGDRAYQRGMELSPEDYSRYTEGQAVEVLYNPADRLHATLNGHNAFPLLAVGVFLMGMVINVFVVMSINYMLHQLKKSGNLVRDGKILTGEILGCRGYESHEDPDNDDYIGYVLEIAYLVQIPGTTELFEGRRKIYDDRWRDKPLPPRRTPVKVLFLNERNQLLL